MSQLEELEALEEDLTVFRQEQTDWTPIAIGAAVVIAVVAAVAYVVATSPSTTSTTPVSVSIEASDPSDIYPRNWEIFVDQPPGAYQGGGIYANTPTISEVHSSGDTLTDSLPLTPGAHTIYFVISQSGGSAYGTYSGTAVIGGKSFPFSGLIYSNYATFQISV